MAELRIVRDGEEPQTESQEKITSLARDIAAMLPRFQNQRTEIDNTIIEIHVRQLPHDAHGQADVHNRVDITLRRKGRKPAYVVSGVYGGRMEPALSSARIYYDGLDQAQLFGSLFDSHNGPSDNEVYALSMETIRKRLSLLLQRNSRA